jgi:hypothetical protein
MIDRGRQHEAGRSKYWKEEVQGQQQLRGSAAERLVFKVPHYKSGDELARAVAEARSKGLLR